MTDTADKRRGLGQSARLLVVFQVKLAADALRDLFLSPVSLVCILLDWALRLDPEKGLYPTLMRLGAESDRFINLFGQHKDSQNVEDLVKSVEKKIGGDS